MRKPISVLASTGAFVLTSLGLFILGMIVEPQPGADISGWLYLAAVPLLLGVALWVVSRLLRRRQREERADAPPPLPFAPDAGDGWRPRADWARLPDPLPGVRPAQGLELTVYPNAPVPPDEILRRLWLVRAHLVQLRQTSVVPPRVFGYCLALGALGMLAVIVVWFALSPDVEPWYGVPALLGGVPLFGLVLRLLYVVLKDYWLGVRRFLALWREQDRLAALDARRPGGPRGGPNVSKTNRKQFPDGVYTPPLPESAPESV